MTGENTCNLDPFQSPVVAQIGSLPQAASAVEILTQTLENYLARMKTAICQDFNEIVIEAGSFLSLTDTPDTYAGAVGELVRVNGTETGLIFSDLSFLELSDTPSTYAAQAGKVAVVNPGETGLIFDDFPPAPTYFLTPRLIGAWAPTVTTGMFGTTPAAVAAAQQQIPVNPGNTLLANYRQRYTATGANAISGARDTVFQAIRGTGAPMGGFRLRYRFGVETSVSATRMWVGLWGAVTAPLGNADPSSNTNCIWLGFDAGDTLPGNYFIMYNDNAGTCTRDDTGLARNGTSLLEFVITMEPSASSFTWELFDLSAGTSFSGAPNSNLPVGGQPLCPQFHIGAAGSGGSPAISLISMFLEVGPSP
jgi:hypothetical protein